MRRTRLLQEVRKKRFEEVYGGWRKRSLTQEEAARVLGVCQRTFRPLVDRYEESGLGGLVDRRLIGHAAELRLTRCFDSLSSIKESIRAGMPSTFMPGTAGMGEHGATLGSNAVFRRRG